MEKAIALKYTLDLPAPFIIAKGKRELARKIEEIARKNGIPVVPNYELTEGLFGLELGSFIPEEYYEIIAKLLVFVAKFGV
jgi:type III secretion system FlhB-like substrate exporter